MRTIRGTTKFTVWQEMVRANHERNWKILHAKDRYRFQTTI